MKNYKWIIALLLFLTNIMALAGVSTTDISGILPHGGKMIHLTGDTDQNSWVLDWDKSGTNSSYAFFDTYGNDSYVVLRAYPTTDKTNKDARVAAGPNLTIPMDMSTVKREELLVTITFRGSPDSVNGGGYIFGKLQPQINSAYLGTFGRMPRQAGVSTGFLEAVSMKGISIDPSTINNTRQTFNYGTYMINTAWTTYTWRFIPTQANYYKLGYIGVIYMPDAYNYPPGPVKTTDIQIKEIKLQAINYY